MKPPRRVTQQDIARAAGVNRATVSLALRAHASIPVTTRTRIEKLAKKLGYQPDPMLSALASYRHGRRPAGFRGTLGWLAHTTKELAWRDIPHFTTYLEAASTHAATHGYRVEVIDLHDMGINWQRAAAVAKSRGIDGLLLCPQPHAATSLDQFPWQDFSAVTFGYTMIKPKLHRIASAQYAATFRTMQELFARGYRRIGFVFNHQHDERTNHHYLAGYLTARELHDPLANLPPCIDDTHDPAQPVFWRWFERHKPDAIVTGDRGFLDLLKTRNLRAPDNVGVACPGLSDLTGPLAGVCEDNAQLGRIAVDYLVSMLHRGERGVPAHPQQVLAEGIWTPGRTLRPLPSD
ncbi:MAG TPA: LacI family DNA-binding transcriptional regulator [Rariglobus sp.]|nr:LacI family DNA-binding transcriptional regulator [Rariglobus sp.]